MWVFLIFLVMEIEILLGITPELGCELETKLKVIPVKTESLITMVVYVVQITWDLIEPLVLTLRPQ